MDRLALLAADARREMAGDPAHDFEHAMRVCRNAEALCRAEGADPGPAMAAALLHDLAPSCKASGAPGAAARESARRAEAILRRRGYAEGEVAVIAGAIRRHSYSSGEGPGTEAGRILQDADRLDAIGAIGIARAFAVAGAEGRPLYDPADPFCAGRGPDDSRWTVDHFYAKLLRLAPRMHTAAARAEAGRRAAAMRAFLDELRREVGAPRGGRRPAGRLRARDPR